MQILIKLVVGLAAMLFVVTGINHFLSPSDELKQADVIVAISGGDTTARTNEAIKLYQEGWAPKLIFSGAAQDPKSPSNATIMKQQAVESGVPSEVIAIDEQAKNTSENARQSRSLVQREKYKSIVLVTSPYHQRRAYVEFSSKLGPDVEIINHSATDPNWSRRWWWISPYGWYLTLTEMIKTGVVILQNL